MSVDGLHRGSRIYVRGAGKYRFGTISREPEPNAPYVTYRADYNLGERMVPVAAVRRVDRPLAPRRKQRRLR